MAEIFVEHRELAKDVTLTWDLAHHLCARYAQGSVVIIAENPPAILAALRKQWLKVIRKLRKEYSRSLAGPRKRELTRVIQEMEALPFAVTLPEAALSEELGVYLIAPADLARFMTLHETIYVTCKMPKQYDPRLSLLPGGIVIDYYAPLHKEG